MKEATSTSRRRGLALATLGLYALLIFAGSSVPAAGELLEKDLPDYLLHSLEFAILGFLCARWLYLRSGKTGAVALQVIPFLLCTLYALTDELHQAFVPHRDASFADVVADALGCLVGATSYRFLVLWGRRRVAAAVVVTLLASFASLAGAEETALTPAVQAIRPADLVAHAEFLSAPELAGRDTPSRGLDLASRYIASRFTSYGLEPAGADGTWFLPVPVRFRRDREESFVRMLSGGAPATFSGEDVALLGDSPDGDGAGPVAFAGYGIDAPKLTRNDFEGLDLTGKVAVILTGTPGGDGAKNPYRRIPDQETRRRVSLPGRAAAAAERGAVAVIFVTGPAERSVDRIRTVGGEVLEGRSEKTESGYRISMARHRRYSLAPSAVERIVLKDGREISVRPAGERRWLDVIGVSETRSLLDSEVASVERGVAPLPRGGLGSGLLRPGSGPAGKIPAIRASVRVLSTLFESGGRTLAGIEASLEEGILSFDVPGEVVLVRVRTRIETGLARNVMARLPGREEGGKAVVLTAHYDHEGQDAEGVIYPGADDNASGTAVLLEVARHLKSAGVRPRTDVLFLAVAGEEKGFLGSAAFVARPPVPLASIAYAVNVDMVGRGVADEVGVLAAPFGTSLLEAFRRAAGPARLRPAFRVVEAEPGPPGEDRKLPRDAGFFGRSDQVSFFRKGIPTAFLFGGLHEDYSRPSDTWQKLNGEKLARVARFTLLTIFDLADR
jgi:VanZ family protein